MRATFPKWKGKFSGCDAVVTEEMRDGKQTVPNVPLITRDEIYSLLVVCKNYKVCVWQEMQGNGMIKCVN